jgi:VCBS repeat-containing protein
LVTITVTDGNTCPSGSDIQGDSYSTSYETQKSVSAPGVLGNDSDPDGDPLDVTAASPISGPTDGTLTLNTDGSFDYDPDNGFSGSDTFTYEATDGNCSAQATVTINVGSGTPPNAGNDYYETFEGQSGNEFAPGVLGNDSDPDGNIVSSSIVSGPTDELLFNYDSDGSFTYDPGNDESDDSFTYQVTDNDGLTDTAAVDITVKDADPNANDDSRTTPQNTSVTVDVLANDSNTGPGSLEVAGIPSGPTDGSASVNPDDTITYTPDPGLTSSDTFTYELTDGYGPSESDTATVSISVTNDPDPTADCDAVPTTVIDGGFVSFDGGGSTDNGTIVSYDWNFDNGSTGSGETEFEYYTSPGVYTPTLTVTDDVGGTDTVDCPDITVQESPNAQPDNYTATSNNQLTVSVPGVRGNDNDPDGNIVSSSIVSGPSDAASFNYDSDGSFNYNPGSDTNDDSFTYRVTDDDGLTDTASVDITVDPPPNTCPSGSDIQDDSYSTGYNTNLSVSAPGVLDNDFDPDGDPLDVTSASPISGPTDGTLTLNTDGSFDYDPDNGFSGSDTFTYEATDGNCSAQATVTITVDDPQCDDGNDNDGDGKKDYPDDCGCSSPSDDTEGSNCSPTADPDNYSTTNLTNLNVPPASGVLDNDSDPNGDSLTANRYPPFWVSDPNGSLISFDSNGSFEYDPPNTFTGTDTFQYVARDGNGGQDQTYVNIDVYGRPNSQFTMTPASSVLIGKYVDLNGNASSDSDGFNPSPEITAYDWSSSAGGAVWNPNTTSAVTDVAFTSTGTKAITLEVTDNDGPDGFEQKGDSTQSINVNLPSFDIDPPSVELWVTAKSDFQSDTARFDIQPGPGFSLSDFSASQIDLAETSGIDPIDINTSYAPATGEYTLDVANSNPNEYEKGSYDIVIEVQATYSAPAIGTITITETATTTLRAQNVEEF